MGQTSVTQFANELKMPAHCAVVSEDEMTYVEGGGYLDALSTAATVVGAVVLGASYVWGIGTARSWLNQKENRKGNVFTVIGRAVNAASRVEALSKSLGRTILITETVAARLDRPLDDLGRHPLRGVAQPVAIFSPRLA